MTIETYKKAKSIVERMDEIRSELSSWKGSTGFAGEAIRIQDSISNCKFVRAAVVDFDKVKKEAIQTLEEELEKLKKQIEEM